MNLIKNTTKTIAEKATDSLLEHTVGSKFEELISNQFGKKTDSDIEKELQEYLLDKYGDERFYNDLDGFLSNNSIISNLISDFRCENYKRPISKEDFVSKNLQDFFNMYSKYKNEKVERSQIIGAFLEIYNEIHSNVVKINSYTDSGKLYSEIMATAAESEYRDKKIWTLLKEMSGQIKSIYDSKSMGFCADTEFDDCSDEVNKIKENIKLIEKEYQICGKYRTAIDKYTELIQSVVVELAGQSKDKINELLCIINCNIALCYENLGDLEKAINSLNLILKDTAEKSKSYHFIYASIIMSNSNAQQRENARQHLERALEIDADYHRAFLLRQVSYAFLNYVDLETNISELATHFASILEADEDESLISDFYINQGNIYLIYNEPYKAEENFRIAKERGYDASIVDYNIAISVYNQVTKGLPKDKRLLYPKLELPTNKKVNNAIAMLETALLDKQSTLCNNQNFRKQAISVYLSMCSMLGKKHKLYPIENYLKDIEDYEAKRALLMNRDEPLTDQEKRLLDESDQLLIHLRELFDNRNFEECKDEMVRLIDSKSEGISLPILDMLLQLCIFLKDSEGYWKYRKIAIAYGIDENDISVMDACAYEIQGDIIKAKEIFNNLSVASCDSYILGNVIRFYKRQNMKEECITLYSKIKELKESDKIIIHDAEEFYINAIEYLVSVRNELAFSFYDMIAPEEMSTEGYDRITLVLYSSINDLYNPEKCLSQKHSNNERLRDRLNRIWCLTRLLKYDDALRECNNLLTITQNEDDLCKIYYLFSDIYLLKHDYSLSVEWANKAHELKKQNPYDQSHQFLFGRAMRCGKHEVIGTILEYKKTHPVVVDWFEPFSIKEGESALKQITDVLDKYCPGRENYEKNEKNIAVQYKKGIMPINLLLEHYNNLMNFFDFVIQNKLHISLGNMERLLTEQNMIKEDLIVDSQTLIIMAFWGCIDSLQCIKNIHITYGSLSTIINYYLTYDLSFVDKLLEWIESSKNIVFEPDDFIDDNSTIVKAFSKNFDAACNVARNNMPVLYSDVLVQMLKDPSCEDKYRYVEFVSIPALCNYYGVKQPQSKNQMLYSLMRGTTFINFNADTIIEQIESKDYDVTYELIEPFLTCNSNCDVKSFVNVYLCTIDKLKKLNIDATVNFTEIILKNAISIWKKGSYYRVMSKKYKNGNARDKSVVISYYAYNILCGIKERFDDTSKNIYSLCLELEDLMH